MNSDTMPVRKGEELDVKTIETFLRTEVENLPIGDLQVEQFSFGRSNLTYLLKIGEWEAVLRRPPMGSIAPKAHDMEREHFVMKEVYPFFQQTPKVFAFADESVLGVPFFVMERKKGVVLEDRLPDGIQATKKLGKQISDLMVDTMVSLHNIDYQKTKLTEITKPEGFLERQVHGWIKRYERVKTEDIKGMEQLKNWLVQHIPQSPEPTIVHYDFKLNNVMFNQDLNKLIGVFDWEMTTVGDPLADLATSLVFWFEKNDSNLILVDKEKRPLTMNEGFYTREEFIHLYAKKSGRSIQNMNYYLCFAFFKLSVIRQQLYYRWKSGKTKDERLENYHKYVANMIQYCQEIAKIK